uniref:Uncharacterized protein n=1 Tax=Romanomermis culicivorax TaxID=13658 RepID=A0A915I075_ROMCU
MCNYCTALSTPASRGTLQATHPPTNMRYLAESAEKVKIEVTILEASSVKNPDIGLATIGKLIKQRDETMLGSPNRENLEQ